jgi:hypothetical protein
VVATGVGLSWGEGLGLGVLVHVAVADGVSVGVGVAVWLGVLLRGCDTGATGTVGAANRVAVAVSVGDGLGDGLGNGLEVGLTVTGPAVATAPVGMAAAAGMLLQPARVFNMMISSRQAASITVCVLFIGLFALHRRE